MRVIRNASVLRCTLGICISTWVGGGETPCNEAGNVTEEEYAWE